jgi:uncharacterized protein (DUF1015 family)
VAVIKPFKALRPVPQKAEAVGCGPYDVIYDGEVRRAIAENPLTFLRVTRAEAEFPAGIEPSPDEVFAAARRNLDELIDSGVLFTDDEEAFYVYRLSMDGHSQTGIVACCSLDDYESGVIKKHENVRPDKVADRTAHLLGVRAQTGLIFLAFRSTSETSRLLSEATASDPIYDFYSPPGVRQQMWRVTNNADWVAAFGDIPSIYIADGHHRAESARRARTQLRDSNPAHDGSEEYNYVLAGLFPSDDLQILAYNRVVADLNGMTAEEFLASFADSFMLIDEGVKLPENHGEICVYIGGRWLRYRFNVQYVREPDPVERLDVSILENFVLRSILGIEDVTTDARIAFVGGGRGTDELERLVDKGEAAIAFSMYPTTMDDLLTVSDAGEIMPPKSTWFEPKLKDGLLIHEI